VGAGHDRQLAAAVCGPHALGVTESAHALVWEEVGGQRLAAADGVFDFALAFVAIGVCVPAAAARVGRAVERQYVVDEEALAEQFGEELHHLRVGGGDVEYEVVVGQREVLRHHALPGKTVGGQGGVEEALLIHIIAEALRLKGHLLRTAATRLQKIRGNFLRIGFGYAADFVVDGAPVGAGDDGVVHRLDFLQALLPLRAAGIGEDALPDPVAFALEKGTIEGGEDFRTK